MNGIERQMKRETMVYYRFQRFCFWKLFLTVCLIHVQSVNSDLDSDGMNAIGEIEEDFLQNQKKVHDEIQTQCRAYMAAYGKATSSLIECLISHARPLTLCENCKTQYDEAAELFTNITNVEGDEYINCHDSLLRSDIIHVVGQTYDFVERIWKESACGNCFNKNNTKYHLTDDFIHFKNLVNETDTCMKKYMLSHSDLYAREYQHDRKNNTYNHTACSICRKPYNELNKFYDELEERYKKAVCMDMVDTMNYTRYTWSADFQCTVKKRDRASIASLAGFFCLLPIAFYVGTKLHGTKQQKQILKQKRLQRRGSLNYGAASTILADENPANSVSMPTEQDVTLDDERDIHDQTPTVNSSQIQVDNIHQNSKNERIDDL